MRKLTTKLSSFLYSLDSERHITQTIKHFFSLCLGMSTISFHTKVMGYTSPFRYHRFFVLDEENRIFNQKIESPTDNEVEFCGSWFSVNNWVLQPRKKTEKVVSVAIFRLKELLKKSDQPIKIIDVGTGSGNIVISIAKRFKGQRIQYFATDISYQAIKIAKLNAVRHGVLKSIGFINSDLVSCLDFQPDLIVANLPYEPHRKEPFSGSTNEPFEARFDDGDGTLITNRLIQQVISHGLLPSILILESAPELILRIRDFVLEESKYPPREINIYSDHKNQPRVIEFLW
jgi:release factor glutamine methyltransferase